MLSSAREKHILPEMNGVIETLREMAHQEASSAMLARTHGQPATPTTIGKEMANFAYRMSRQRDQFASVRSCKLQHNISTQHFNTTTTQVPILAKFNGAVGNFNAHAVACPSIDWPEISKQFVTDSLGLEYNPYVYPKVPKHTDTHTHKQTKQVLHTDRTT